MESTEGAEHLTFLKTKGTGYTEIFQNQQPLKKEGTDQIMDRGQTMEVREGNKPVELLKANQMFDEYIYSVILFHYGTLYSVVIIYNSPYQIYLTTSCDQDILGKPELLYMSIRPLAGPDH